MAGVSESKVRLSVQRTPVRNSRSSPNRHKGFGRSGESDPDLHLENDSSSEVVRDWFLGSCIQLASIDFPRGWEPVRRLPTSEVLGAVAQLGERLICIQEVAGSIPTSSTRCVKRLGL